MIIIIGLVILVVAAIAGIAAVLGNAGHGHALTSGFSMLGYHVTGSTGTLFLYGIVVGAVAMLGLALLLGGARRSSRRGIAARRSLRQSRREQAAVSQDRDDLIGQRDEAENNPGDDAHNRLLLVSDVVTHAVVSHAGQIAPGKKRSRALTVRGCGALRHRSVHEKKPDPPNHHDNVVTSAARSGAIFTIVPFFGPGAK